MWISEATWIGNQINAIQFQGDSINCLNIGSSTQLYREQIKPYIHEMIIKPIEIRGNITHLDAKMDRGVDISGDLSNPGFRKSLGEKKYNLILCNNVLTHVPDPGDVFDTIKQCLAEDGFLIISAPSQYPYCADPFDSKYRPSRFEIERMLPTFETIRFTTFESSETLKTRLASNPRQLLAFIINLIFPRHGLNVWKNIASDLFEINKRFASIGLLMKRR